MKKFLIATVIFTSVNVFAQSIAEQQVKSGVSASMIAQQSVANFGGDPDSCFRVGKLIAAAQDLSDFLSSNVSSWSLSDRNLTNKILLLAAKLKIVSGSSDCQDARAAITDISQIAVNLSDALTAMNGHSH